VNLDTLAERFDDGTVITPDLLRERGLIHSTRQPVKVLARGDISKKLTVHAHKFSGKAAEKIAAAGGATELLASKAARATENTKRADDGTENTTA
jgi:large subunit ribosomal protein L15